MKKSGFQKHLVDFVVRAVLGVAAAPPAEACDETAIAAAAVTGVVIVAATIVGVVPCVHERVAAAAVAGAVVVAARSLFGRAGAEKNRRDEPKGGTHHAILW